jgi:hypothetical protein
LSTTALARNNNLFLKQSNMFDPTLHECDFIIRQELYESQSDIDRIGFADVGYLSDEETNVMQKKEIAKALDELDIEEEFDEDDEEDHYSDDDYKKSKRKSTSKTVAKGRPKKKNIKPSKRPKENNEDLMKPRSNNGVLKKVKGMLNEFDFMPLDSQNKNSSVNESLQLNQKKVLKVGQQTVDMLCKVSEQSENVQFTNDGPLVHIKTKGKFGKINFTRAAYGTELGLHAAKASDKNEVPTTGTIEGRQNLENFNLNKQ